jgi:hypothetical protein
MSVSNTVSTSNQGITSVQSIESQLLPVLLGNGKEGLKHLVYYQIVTKALPVVLKGIANGLRSIFKKRMQKHIDHIASLSVKTKTASVILQRDYEKDNDVNILFDAVLTYVSELPQTKHVKRTTTGVFIMASKEEIEMSSCIFVRKLSEAQVSDKITKLTIEVYSYTYDLTTLRKYMDDIEERYKLAMSNQLGKNIFYFDELPFSLPLTLERKPDLSKAPPRLMFSKYPLYTNKSLKNIYGDSVKVVRKRVDFFVNNKRWYEEKGVPYTLGLLLHGVPGAGKTSCIKSIAKDTNRHILNIRLSESTTVSQLNALFYSSQVQVTQNGETKFFDIPIDRRIIVLEDIDCLTDVVLSRENKDNDTNNHNFNNTQDSEDNSSHKIRATSQSSERMLPQQPLNTQNEKLNLSILLNILDGVLEQPGRILIMTSNHPEKLDKALIRPGRIDVIVKFDYCKKHEVIEIIEAFTNKKVNAKDSADIVDGVLTPAEVSRVIFENIEDVPSIIQKLSSQSIESRVLNNPVYEHNTYQTLEVLQGNVVEGNVVEGNVVEGDVQVDVVDVPKDDVIQYMNHIIDMADKRKELGWSNNNPTTSKLPSNLCGDDSILTQPKKELCLDDFFNTSM